MYQQEGYAGSDGSRWRLYLSRESRTKSWGIKGDGKRRKLGQELGHEDALSHVADLVEGVWKCHLGHRFGVGMAEVNL